MSMSDPIADMFTRIRNGQAAKKVNVSMPSAKIKVAIAEVLKQEGYITDYSIATEAVNKPELTVILKYYEDKPVIENLKRISRPGLRIYRTHQKLPRVMGGLGISIISTSKGLMTDRQARQLGMGGEILGEVA